MSVESKIEKLVAKKKALAQEIEALQKMRHQELSEVLQKVDLKEMDTYTLVGGILNLLKAQHTDHVLEEWRNAGRRFCTKARSKKSKPLRTSEQKDAA